MPLPRKPCRDCGRDKPPGRSRKLCNECAMGLHFLENWEWRDAAEGYLASPPAGKCAPLLSEVVS